MKPDHPLHEGQLIGYISSFKHHTYMLLFHLKNCNATGTNRHSIKLAFSHGPNETKDFFSTPCVFESFEVFNHEELNDTKVRIINQTTINVI